MQIPSAKHFSKQTICDFSDNEVLVSVSLLLMLLLHQEEEERTKRRGKAGLMCAVTSIPLLIRKMVAFRCPKSYDHLYKIVLCEL